MESERTIRTLTADDIFPVVTIINKIGLKEFKECFNSADVKDKNVEAVGLSVIIDISSIIMKNLPSCKEEIYEFIESITGIENISEMPMVDFAELIVDIIKMDDFKNFFKVVSKLLK